MSLNIGPAKLWPEFCAHKFEYIEDALVPPLVPVVKVTQVRDVDERGKEKVATREPHEHRGLETWRQIWAGSVDSQVVVLKQS